MKYKFIFFLRGYLKAKLPCSGMNTVQFATFPGRRPQIRARNGTEIPGTLNPKPLNSNTGNPLGTLNRRPLN